MRIVLADVRDLRATVVTLGRHPSVRSVALPGRSGGDPPVNLARVGGWVVFYGRDRPYALPGSLAGGSRRIYRGLYFIPSAAPGRVWVAIQDPRQPSLPRLRRPAARPAPAPAGLHHALFAQVAQSSACNRLHPIEQRCARWLLLTQDRVGSDVFPLTQEFLAQRLGVQRTSVNAVARTLSEAGAIAYKRTVITVRDRARPEAASCECYAIIIRESERNGTA